MRKTVALALCAGVATLYVQARDLRIIRLDGQVDSYPLADIDSLTFTPEGNDGLETLLVHQAGQSTAFLLASVDSVCFHDEAQLVVHKASGSSQFDLATIDSLTFAAGPDPVVEVAWSAAGATVVNPLAELGLSVTVSGGDVTVDDASGVAGVEYVLSGSRGDGMFKVYSAEDFQLTLDGLSLTNSDGPAINIQADVTIDVVLPAGRANSLADGATYGTAPDEEDQKAAFFSEGQLVFSGSGSLTVAGHGTDQHGLASDDFVEVRGGTVVVSSAVKDALHTNEGYIQSGGTVQLASSSDGVDAGDGDVSISGGQLTVVTSVADKNAVACDGLLAISGGTVGLTVQGNQSKGLNAPTVELTGGTVTVQTSGGVVLEASGSGYDPAYCTAVNADELVLLDGCQLTITTSGQAARGIACDGLIRIASGSLTATSSGSALAYTDETGARDAATGPFLKADGNIELLGGTLTMTHSGNGGRCVSGDARLTVGVTGSGPTLQATVTGGSVSIGGGEYAESKTIKADSLVTILGGTLTLSSTDDALKSETRVDLRGGTVNITSSLEGVEAPYVYVYGGELRITATDDAINTTMGNDIEGNDGSMLAISGGYVHTNSPQGDGLDSNGNLTISGGTVVVHGPPAQPEVGLDVNGTFRMDGGTTVVAQINSNMVELPVSASAQRTVMLRKTSGSYSANTLVHIEDAAGNHLLTFAPARAYSNVLFSAPGLAAGTTYRVYTGGTCTGTVRDGLYTGGTYSGGTLRATFTSNSVVQSVNF